MTVINPTLQFNLFHVLCVEWDLHKNYSDTTSQNHFKHEGFITSRNKIRAGVYHEIPVKEKQVVWEPCSCERKKNALTQQILLMLMWNNIGNPWSAMPSPTNYKLNQIITFCTSTIPDDVKPRLPSNNTVGLGLPPTNRHKDLQLLRELTIKNIWS